MIPEKTKRVGRAIQRVMMVVLTNEITSPDIDKFTEITRVDLTKDMRIAKAYLHIFADNEVERDKKLKAFEKASSYFRKRIAEEINLRHCPEVRFYVDKGAEKGSRVLDLLNEIHKNTDDD